MTFFNDQGCHINNFKILKFNEISQNSFKYLSISKVIKHLQLITNFLNVQGCHINRRKSVKIMKFLKTYIKSNYMPL